MAEKKKYPRVDQANKFARDIIAGRIPACRWVKLACQRHLTDLAASRTRGYAYKFDAAEAEKKLRIIELLPHTKGEWGFKRQLITLEPWQKFGLACTFGWKHKKTGYRRFRESYWEVCRKNGKSVIGAGVAHGHVHRRRRVRRRGVFRRDHREAGVGSFPAGAPDGQAIRR